MRKRYEEIDIMRGIAIIAMIAIHTAAYYPQIPVIFALWDTLEFAVPIFIFCSAYLFFKQEYHQHVRHTVNYFKKRFLRLMLPYYTFLILYIPLIHKYEHKKVTQSFIIDNIFLTGGIDFNWMVLLFLTLSFLMPLFMYWFARKRRLFIVYTAVAAASSVIFLFWRPYDHYRVFMILPWSLLIIFSWIVASKEENEGMMVKLFLGSTIVFFAARAVLMLQRAPIDHFNNKYPPNIFHLSYGFLSIIGLFYLAHIVRKSHGILRQFISFFSKYSYSIYFIHIYVIHVITVAQKTNTELLGFPAFFAKVLLITAAAQFLLKSVRGAING